MTKRCLIMAGGTGGHVFPGLAVANAMKEEGWEVHWLGTAERMEADLVPKYGIPIHFIPVKGIRGKGLKAKLSGLWALIASLFSARKIIKQLAPNIVIGFGGYASGPGGVAAKSLGIPVVIHEQNAAAGMTNRLLARIASKVLLGFGDAKSQFEGITKVVETVGNPVRNEIAQINARVLSSSALNVLVIGGSLGAKVLNETLPSVCANLNGIAIRHQCGKGNQAEVKQRYVDAQYAVEVDEFIDDMAKAYEWADLIVCRAGALTVSEVAAAGRAAIFVPLPHAVDDHQTKNAMSLVSRGAAILIPQQELALRLHEEMCGFINNPEKCISMGAKARQASSSYATEKVVSHCVAVAGVGA